MHISPGVQPTKTRGLNIKHQIKLIPKCYKCIKLCPFVLYCCTGLIQFHVYSFFGSNNPFFNYLAVFVLLDCKKILCTHFAETVCYSFDYIATVMSDLINYSVRQLSQLGTLPVCQLLTVQVRVSKTLGIQRSIASSS